MGVRNPSLYKGPEFRSFRTFLCEWLVHQDMSKVDYVFRPQFGFIQDGDGNVIVDYVGKLETLSRDIPEIAARIEFTFVLEHVNRTGTPGLYRDAYESEEMIAAVHEVYGEDVRRFGYSF